MPTDDPPPPAVPARDRGAGWRATAGVLVRNFYLALQVDPELGPVFARHVADWPRHYETLTDFWSLQTGGPPVYRGRLLQAHAPLGLRSESFDRWLAQWRQSCRLHFAEAEAAEMIALAERLGSRMRETLTSADPLPRLAPP